MQKTNVLFLVDKSGFGGVQTIADEIIHRAVSPEAELTIFFLRNINHRFGMLNYDNKNVYYSNSQKRYSLDSFFEIKKYFDNRKIDIVHCNGNKSIIFSVLLKILTRSKVTIIQHEHGGVFDDKWYYYLLIKLFDPYINKYITLTEYRKTVLQKKSSVPLEKVYVINNFLPLKEKTISSVDEVLKLKKCINWSKDAIYFGYIGGLSNIKGVDLLLQAFSILLRDKPNCKLIIAGDGPERENLEKLMIKLNLQKNVVFIGYVKNSSIFFNVITYCVVPSRSEAFGIVLLEAWSNLKPIILSDIPVFREVAKISGGPCVFFETENAKSLSNAMLSLCQAESIILKTEFDLLKFQNKFSFDVFLSKIFKLYELKYEK